MKSPVPRIALTPGEPAGIGPDICVLIAQKEFPCELVAVADGDLLRDRAQNLGLSLTLSKLDASAPIEVHRPGTLKLLPVRIRSTVHYGQLNPENALYVIKTISRATKACIKSQFHAMVTGPIHKGVINEAGIPFSGHTEYLSTLTGGYPVMMLTTPGLRVALATTHLPLREVSHAITRNRLLAVLRTLYHDLKLRFGIEKPYIIVCGLNPHAGEGGYLGHEEIDIIEPTLNILRRQGMQLNGPLAADTAFTSKYLENADAILAMYHDQGLPVLKYAGFGNAVNITLGLPIIRTSVDHGTALDLAGTKQVDTRSLEAAIHTAIEMAVINPDFGVNNGRLAIATI